MILVATASAADLVSNGVLEEATCFPPHYFAGASPRYGWFWLPAGAVGFLLSAVTLEGRRIRFAISIVSFALAFYFLPMSLGRTASSFDERAFREIVTKADQGMVVTLGDVHQRLGDPIIRCDNGLSQESWHFTYMPSAGYGWNKKVLWFADGRVTRWANFSEP